MKKRMIAWLLCACMTFTAAPEMLLADVAAKGQQTQEDEKSAGTGQTETETDRLEEEDQNSEKLTEEKEEIENQEQTEITEETETTESESTEETESAETELTEETEMIEESEAPEETEDVTEETESAEEILKRALSGDEISRIAWVEELITLFDLTVEEDNYPDNYYSDISADDSFYRDVMVACEYGMIDLAAGEEFRPEDAVTREFAAQTMNAMLGFVPETDSYTYQDTADVTYKEAAQVAIDRGWVTVSGDKFLPGQSLTTKEHDAMIADTKQVLSDAQIETGKENTCTFASGVVIVPEGTAVSIDVDGTVMIENCPVTITQGTTFAVYVNDIAMAYKAKSVRKEGTTTYITTSDAEDGAVLNVDQQGELDVDLTEFVPADEETYVVNNVAVTESKTRGISYDGNTLRADKTISISDDVTATVNVVISNMKVNYRLKNNDYYFTVSGDMEYSCNVKGDAFKDINHTLTLGAVPLGGIGMLTLAMEYNLSGEATLTVEKEFEAGFAYSDGFRVVGNSRKKGFSFSAEADLTTGVVLSAKATLGIVSGDISAKAGARMNIKYVRYSSGTPAYCVSQAAYLYASVGASAKIGVGILSKTFSKSIEIWGKDNSPVRVCYHIEDGVLRTSCTRGKEFIAQGGWTSYWTSPGSRYFNPAGVGSYFDAGAGTGGAIVPIYTYTLDDANRATITGYNGSAAALYIPEEIDGHEVVAIGDGAFKNRTDLKTVMIPDSVTKISGMAFYGCSGLGNVTLSKNLKSLGSSTFGNCDGLTQIEIPKSLERAGDDYFASYAPGAFSGCKNLKHISFEEGITEIAYKLFSNCTGLEEITIPDTVTTIKGNAFYECSNLSKVKLSENLTVIEADAFQECNSLQNIELPEGLSEIKDRAFYQCSNLKEIKIPDSVTKIEGSAFYECKKLQNVTLSKNLESLGSSTFGNCDGLTQIEIPKSLERAGDDYFASYAPGAFSGCKNLKNVSFEAGTTVIAYKLFSNCTGLEKITIPDTVTTIKGYAFYECSNLKEIQIGNGLKEIGDSVFYECTSLQKVLFPDTVNSMGTSIFYNCINLTEVHLPNIRQNIMANTFYNCKKLTTINFPSTLTTIEDSAFSGCESLPEAILPSGVEKIESNAFENCKSLKKAVVPDTVSSIGGSAFYGCEALTDITLGSKLKKIDSQTFYGCAALPSIMIPYSVTAIGDSAFVNCTKLTQITVPRNTTSIASNAFSYPKKMTMYGPSGCYAQTYANGKGIKYVAQDIHATSIRLDITNKMAEYYDEFQLTATIAPQNFTDAVTWTSSNEDVATVSDTGYVEVCGVGTAVITVTAGNVKAACTVTVPQLIDWIEFDEDEIELKSGETYQLRPDISPSNATNKKLKYTSSDTKVAEVSASGLVTAKSEGEARIRAAATDGSDEYAVCYVTVTGKAKVTGITLNQTSATLGRGKKLALKAAISPSYASNKKVVWKSANTKVATVDGSGNVTAKAPGRTKITVTSAENSSYQASCTVTVPYNITYKLNKGKNNASNPSTYYGKKITLKNPSRKGYTFAGWYTDAKFKKKIKTIESSAKCDYTLYAKWTKVNVAKVSITSAKNSKSKQILLKYKKISGIKGYEISYSTDKKFKKAVTRKNTTKTSYTISKLKKGKTYYVRIRAYKVDSTGKKVYGKYTSVKKVKVSK
ncbi:leucine-rich repeat protein [Roseburia intestinalis]|uniref:leucine-rich repeat protein n=1 Tax=Roseburia intestinalis TaxID=166486 RepID=UPI0022E09CA6|nr:leucine-rich repeat protein [Roseburia intestinalis]